MMQFGRPHESTGAIRDLHPLRESLAFCIEAEVDTLDLRRATASELIEVSVAIEQVLNRVDEVRLHDPAAAPFFLAQVQDLWSRLTRVLAEPERG